MVDSEKQFDAEESISSARDALVSMIDYIFKMPEASPIPVEVAVPVLERFLFFLEHLERWTADDKTPTELIAWACRQLYELTLMIQYLLEVPSGVKQFTLAAELADAQIKLRVVAARSDLDAQWQEYAVALNGLKASAKRVGFPAEIWPGVHETVERLGAKAEYDEVYKLFSQYAHPVPWVLMKTGDKLGVYRLLMVAKAMVFCSRAIGMFHKALKPIDPQTAPTREPA